MVLGEVYRAFLRTPSVSLLAPDASINYLPTTTTIAEPAAILKHLSSQARRLKKTKEAVLSTIEGSNGLCLEVETSLEFITGGGAYLPGLDDNFLANHAVTFPVVHIVGFNAEQKISSIRMHWDQASLLRQVEVIGSRARNWPIRDGRDQIRLIAKCVASDAPGDTGSRPQTSRSNTSATTDPHASLSLFAPHEDEEDFDMPCGPSVERARSAKPPSRGLHEIISPEHQAAEPNTSPSKAGAAKHYHPIRVFDQETGSGPRNVKSSPKKYDHFEFKDFQTAETPRTKILPQHAKSSDWGNGDDLQTPPPKRPVVHQPRKDAMTHFDFDDKPTPIADKKRDISGRGMKHSKGLSLYRDPIIDGDTPHSDKKGPLSDVSTNTNKETHVKSPGISLDLADALDRCHHVGKPGDENSNGIVLPESDWAIGRQSPIKPRGINIGGDGMGGRKGSERDWLFGDMPSQPQTTTRKSATKRDPNQPSVPSFWDF